MLRDREIAHDCREADHRQLHPSLLSLYLEGGPCLLEGGEAEKQRHGPEPQQDLSALQSLHFHMAVRTGTRSQRLPAPGPPGLSFPEHSRATVLTALMTANVSQHPTLASGLLNQHGL